MLRFFIYPLMLVLVLAHTSVALAQPADESSEQSTPSLFCVNPAAVVVGIKNEIKSTVPGVPMTFVAMIKNMTPQTFGDTTLVARVYKQSEDDALADGHILLDQFVVEKGISLEANGTKEVIFEWAVPNLATEGEYFVTYVLTTEEGYSISSGEETGGKGLFFVEADTNQTSGVAFNHGATTINDEDVNLGSRETVISADSVQIKTTLTNPSNSEKTVPVQWNQYAVDYASEKNKRFTKTEVVTLAPNETKELVYDVQPQPEAAVVVTAFTEDGESTSMLAVPYIKVGGHSAYLHLPELSGFPLAAGSEYAVSACVKIIQEIESQTSITFTLTDSAGEIIHQVTQAVASEVGVTGYGESFTPSQNYENATLTVTLTQNGVVTETYTKTYSCTENCFEGGGTSFFFDFVKQNFITLLLGFVVIVLFVALITHFIRHRKVQSIPGPIVPLIIPFFFLLMPIMLFLYPQVGEAAVFPSFSSYNGYDIQNYYSYTGGTRIEIGASNRTNVSCPAIPSPTSQACEDQAYINCVNLCAAGSYSRCDIRRASIADTPDGGTGQVVWRCFGYSGGVLTPTPGTWGSGTSHDGIPNANSRYHLWSSITVATPPPPPPPPPPSNNPPNTPTIIGTTGGSPNTNYSFDFNATDPDGNTLRYGVDWDNNSTVDQWVPGAGYVNSGVTQSGTRNWGSGGTYTFQVLAQDSQGANSGWANHSITLSEAPPSAYTVDRGCGATGMWVGMNCAAGEELRVDCAATERGWERPTETTLSCPMNPFSYTGYRGICVADATCGVPAVDLKVNGSDGPISVVRGAALTLNWSAAYVPSCTKFGANWGSGQGVALTGSETISAITSDTYLLNCNGTIDSVSVTVVNQPPNAPSVTHPTGTADYGVNTTFTITGSDPDNDSVFYEIDWDNNGSVDATTATVPSGTALGAVRSWSVTGPQTFQARTVDIIGARSGWTPHTITINNPPPATATLEASINGGGWSTTDQTVNSTDSVALRWSSTNSTGCSGSGGNFAPSGTAGSVNVNTPGANSSIAFGLTCTGPGGNASDTLTITTRQLPNLTEPAVYTPVMGTFNQGTGAYNGMTLSFRTENNGGSNIPADSDYRFRLDLNNDGSFEIDETRVNALPAGMGVGSGTNESEATSLQIPIGVHRVEITVDSSGNPGKVTETNEGDNVFNDTITIPAANPGLTMTVSPERVQNGQNATVTWAASTAYPMTCSVFGPGMTTKTFNLSSPLATDNNISAGPITAKSEYTIRCDAAGTIFTATDTVETQGVIEEI